MAIKYFREVIYTSLKNTKAIIEGKPFIVNESQYQLMAVADLDSKLQKCGYTISLLDVKNEREYSIREYKDDDIEYLRKKLLAAFKIPKSFLGYEEDLI